MPPSMYAQYIKEKTTDFIVEYNSGFATYRFVDDTTVYILDIWIDPVYRKEGRASVIADHICDIAKAKGCTMLLGSVVPSSKGATDSIKVLLSYGMHVHSAVNDMIFFKKEL